MASARSSTRVREALAAGDLATAEKLLGRPYRMCGRVAHGAKLGRTIGIPTANGCTGWRHRTAYGWAFLWSHLDGVGRTTRPWRVASVGTRPTVDGKHTAGDSFVRIRPGFTACICASISCTSCATNSASRPRCAESAHPDCDIANALRPRMHVRTRQSGRVEPPAIPEKSYVQPKKTENDSTSTR